MFSPVPQHFAPVLILAPESPDRYQVGGFGILPRRWGVGITDWAWLAVSEHHTLEVEYQLADVLIHGCNMELVVEAPDLRSARGQFEWLYASLMIVGVAPFFAPFISTHSINDFSNVSAGTPTDDDRRDRYHALRSGHESVTFGFNLFHFGSLTSPLDAEERITVARLTDAANLTDRWRVLVESDPTLRVLHDALIAAPQVGNRGQSILMMWTALESLFPKVNSELSFRLALYLAQLLGHTTPRFDNFQRVRSAYNTRSAIAHGTWKPKDFLSERRDWTVAWMLLLDVANACLSRGRIPSEDDLTAELLA